MMRSGGDDRRCLTAIAVQQSYPIADRSSWIPGSYAPVRADTHNSFVRRVEKKGVTEESMTQAGWDAIAHPRPWNPPRACVVWLDVIVGCAWRGWRHAARRLSSHAGALYCGPGPQRRP